MVHRLDDLIRDHKLRWLVAAVLLLICCPRLRGQVAEIQLASAITRPNVATCKSGWPHELRVGQFYIHSTTPISQFQSQLPKLSLLPSELASTLKISVSEEPIHIVVLEDHAAMEAYVKRILPNAPSRRALYIRHRGPGLVLTYYSSSWLTDARHECTHAILDASSVKVPQWLDEGLAEYFETADENQIMHVTHRVAVQTESRYGQVADLEQLERMPSSKTMTAKDYRDAWSVVAFLLNSSAQSREAMQTYLQDLQNERAAGFLGHRLKGSVFSWRDEFSRFFRK